MNFHLIEEHSKILRKAWCKSMVVLSSCVISFPFVGSFVLWKISRFSLIQKQSLDSWKRLFNDVLYNLSVALLHTTNDNQLFYFILWFSIINYYLFQCQN
jgi:hypothetical protein